MAACGTLSNLLDKRSRFAPSTHSLMAVCPVPWRLAPVMPDDPLQRWQATGLLRHAPTLPLLLPVRDLRVMYGLKARHYQRFANSQIPHAHEYFVPMEELTKKDSAQDPDLQTLVFRASASANFFPAAQPARGHSRHCGVRRRGARSRTATGNRLL
jgi:hypothetical protein